MVLGSIGALHSKIGHTQCFTKRFSCRPPIAGGLLRFFEHSGWLSTSKIVFLFEKISLQIFQAILPSLAIFRWDCSSTSNKCKIPSRGSRNPRRSRNSLNLTISDGFRFMLNSDSFWSRFRFWNGMLELWYRFCTCNPATLSQACFQSITWSFDQHWRLKILKPSAGWFLFILKFHAPIENRRSRKPAHFSYPNFQTPQAHHTKCNKEKKQDFTTTSFIETKIRENGGCIF